MLSYELLPIRKAFTPGLLWSRRTSALSLRGKISSTVWMILLDVTLPYLLNAWPYGAKGCLYGLLQYMWVHSLLYHTNKWHAFLWNQKSGFFTVINSNLTDYSCIFVLKVMLLFNMSASWFKWNWQGSGEAPVYLQYLFPKATSQG